MEIAVSRLKVVAYSGYQAEQEPRALIVDCQRLEVLRIEDRWYEPVASFFRVRTSDGDSSLLRYDHKTREWFRVSEPSCRIRSSATSSPPSPTAPGR